MSSTYRRACAWAIGALSVAVVVAFGIASVLDLDVADHAASVAVAITAVLGVAASSIDLLRTRHGGADGRDATEVCARGKGALAAGGDVRGNAIGAGSSVTSPTSVGRLERERPAGRATADGDGSIAATGDIVDNAIGSRSSHGVAADESGTS